MEKEKPNVFISYSWEDESHRLWVKDLATKLRNDGVNATIDQFELQPGDRLPQYMETSIREADYVLIICTPHYKEKANDRIGGVGYEGHIITGEMFSKHNERKFIPILRKGSRQNAIPTWLEGKLDVDFSDNVKAEDAYKNLLITLYGTRSQKPPLGTRPDYIRQKANINEIHAKEKDIINTEEDIKILGIITEEVSMPKLDGTRGSALYKMPFRLSRTPSYLWKTLFIETWNHPPKYTTMHRPKIASVIGDAIWLNGTTIEEVNKYHKETLMLSVDIANQKERAILNQQAQETERQKKMQEKHFDEINKLANEIIF
ncbi:toll/interleukin-1 receptor domain-containing protein [Anaerobium acetethylicum]|uniref:SEFIR domain-containing protein n=1 Tax=Anaerobium acetethylicum TaxID=1619234 RepID=A0A1D3TYM1_9FIRM|nr:toll/interleukin-1 receptor domain-containing protein [Anaerobium acetethylicum]SCP99565.1 SEFIR domain-containing protein [Anaerobium acetethylicum]